MNHLLEYEYEISIKPENSDQKAGMWLVEGRTQPTEVNKEILLQWVEYMVAAGYKYGCYFDGWGAEVP